MEQTRITQCPKCDTTFRITPSQLQVAKGAVRCGACLHVFRASEHFQKSIEAAAPDERTHDLFEPGFPQQTQVTDVTSAPASAVKEHEESPYHDPLLDDLFASKEDSLSKVHDELTQTDGDIITLDSQSATDNDNDTTAYPLTDDDLGLIDDHLGLIDDNGYLDKQTAPVEFDEDFLSLHSRGQQDPFFGGDEKLHGTIEKTSDPDEAWAQALLDESDETEEPPAANKPTPIPQVAAATRKNSQPAFSYIKVDPLDLSLPQSTQQRQMLIGLSACLLLAVVIMAQAAYFNFNSWARQDTLRPLYQIACQHLPCRLPSSYDLASIRTTASPQVSSHTRFKDALVVDVLFINGAQYPQAFPLLALTFSDKNEKVVAHRVFRAHEYLAGEAAGLTMMPVQTPIHIALEIADPGPSANNYQVHFLQP